MSTSASELQDSYLDFVEDTECPTLFHRWSLLAGVGAMLERNIHLPFGHDNIYPNQYIVLLGPPASRKSTAINALGKVIKDIGYEKFAGDKSSKEKFIQDMSAGFNLEEEHIDSNTINIEEFLDGDMDKKAPEMSAVFVKASELQDFLGQNNHDFISWLTNMWDTPDVYDYRIRNGESDRINKPTISLLGGATQATFASMFPLNILEQGMMSRMLLVYGEGRRKKIAFPKAPDPKKRLRINEALLKIKNAVSGEIIKSPEAEKMLEDIYNHWTELPDSRFATYGGRRFTHLLKLCMVHAAMRYDTTIIEDDVLLANTILSYTETLMPKALGEFGKSDDSHIATAILNKIKAKEEGVSASELKEALAGITLNGAKIAAVLEQLQALRKIDMIRVPAEDGSHITRYISMQALKTTQSLHTDFSLLKRVSRSQTKGSRKW